MEIQQIINYLSILEEKFLENELAYLQLTSKNEGCIRDKFAFFISQYLYNEIAVTREGENRADLVIYKKINDDNESLVLNDIIEFKLWYAFDILNDRIFYNEIKDAIEKDFEKNKHHNINQFEVLAVVLPKRKEVFNKEYQKILPKSYFSKFNSFIKNHTSYYKVLENCENRISEQFKNYEIRRTKIDCGSAFNCEVEIHFWVMKKV